VGVLEKQEVQRTKINLALVGTGVNQEAWLHGANHTHGSAAGRPCANSPHETTKPIFIGLSEPAPTHAPVVDETVLAVLG
jgi:hypothetical protein